MSDADDELTETESLAVELRAHISVLTIAVNMPDVVLERVQQLQAQWLAALGAPE